MLKTFNKTYLILLLSFSLFGCSQKTVTVAKNAEEKVVETKQAADNKNKTVDEILEEMEWMPAESKDILTKEQIYKYYYGDKDDYYMYLSKEQADRMEAAGFSFFDMWPQNHIPYFTEEQKEKIRRNMPVEFTSEQEAQFAEIEKQEVIEISKKIIQPGTPAPDFELVDSNGNMRKLSEFRGKLVLIDFWGTWCGPCIMEMPKLKKAYDSLTRSQVEFIGICNNCPDFEEFLTENKNFDWVQLNAEESDIASDYGITVYPSLLLISPEGVILDTSFHNEEALRNDKLGTIKKYLKQYF
jgi:peroxiredoxin